jgi:ADP-ribosylglycohydrolase
VNCGNDTDSVAALTGALSGYYYNKVSFVKNIRNLEKIQNFIQNERRIEK